MTNKVYYPYIDILKGIAILLMVMGHVLPWSFDDEAFFHNRLCDLNGSYMSATIVYKVIYSFHMPLLFFASGFLFFRESGYSWEGIKSMLRRRSMRILVPYFVTGFIILAYKGYYGYWFLQVIFIFNVIAALSQWLFQRTRCPLWGELFLQALIWVSMIGLAKYCDCATTQKLLYFNSAAAFYPAFAIGIYIRKIKGIDALLRKDFSMVLLLATYVLCFIFSEFFISSRFVSVIGYSSIILFLFVICSSSANLWSVSAKSVTRKMGGGNFIHREKLDGDLYPPYVLCNEISWNG